MNLHPDIVLWVIWPGLSGQTWIKILSCNAPSSWKKQTKILLEQDVIVLGLKWVLWVCVYICSYVITGLISGLGWLCLYTHTHTYIYTHIYIHMYFVYSVQIINITRYTHIIKSNKQQDQQKDDQKVLRYWNYQSKPYLPSWKW